VVCIDCAILQPEDWYSVRLSELNEGGFPFGVKKIQLVELLETKYPKHKWDTTRLLRGRYAQQKRLERAVAVLFPVRNIVLCDR